MSKMFVKTGDTVMVLSGKSKGVKGEVIAVSPKEGKVIVKNVNKVTKHVKPRK
ncbi:MAG: KOW motif-containing protein, partial [Eubacterium sp.]|nr:KOW motif-containing protein [Eubacterium sp.]